MKGCKATPAAQKSQTRATGERKPAPNKNKGGREAKKKQKRQDCGEDRRPRNEASSPSETKEKQNTEPYGEANKTIWGQIRRSREARHEGQTRPTGVDTGAAGERDGHERRRQRHLRLTHESANQGPSRNRANHRVKEMAGHQSVAIKSLDKSHREARQQSGE